MKFTKISVLILGIGCSKEFPQGMSSFTDAYGSSGSNFKHFITRQGSALFDGDREFRFAGFLAPELHRIEDDSKGTCKGDSRPWAQHFKWPVKEEQENTIKAMKFSGQKVTRMYTLSIAQEHDHSCGRETHILKPTGKDGMPILNEKAMVIYDRMIALADQNGLRLIVPFIDHWEWWGGRTQLAAFYGEKSADLLDINSRTYKAYQYIIQQVITRKNTITGRYYSDEKVIMAWETGNELKDTEEPFLRETAKLIRKLAPNQLIIDGTYLKINDFALNDPNIDIISNHFYAVNGNLNPEQVFKDLKAVNGKKAYLVGEYGLTDVKQLQEITDAIVNHRYKGHAVIGGMIWGLRGQRHNGGFYYHKEESTGHRSYRLPGFPEGNANQELEVIQMIRNAQARMDGQTQPPPWPIPETPKLLPIKDRVKINWMGSPAGRYYRIERSTTAQGPWTTIAKGISNGADPFDPEKDTLYTDKTAQSYQSTYYRIFAGNESGESGPSNTVSNQ